MKKTILKLTLVICLVVASCYLYLQKDNDLNDLVICLFVNMVDS